MCPRVDKRRACPSVDTGFIPSLAHRRTHPRGAKKTSAPHTPAPSSSWQRVSPLREQRTTRRQPPTPTAAPAAQPPLPILHSLCILYSPALHYSQTHRSSRVRNRVHGATAPANVAATCPRDVELPPTPRPARAPVPRNTHAVTRARAQSRAHGLRAACTFARAHTERVATQTRTPGRRWPQSLAQSQSHTITVTRSQPHTQSQLRTTVRVAHRQSHTLTQAIAHKHTHTRKSSP